MSTEFTAEEVRKEADFLSTYSRKTSRMLAAYAATLRQQGERGDGAVSDADIHRLLRSQKPFGELHPSDYERMREAAAPLLRAPADPRLDADARIGNTVIRKGCHWSTVVGRAQREFTYLGDIGQAPAERAQGEAVAKVRHFDYRGITRDGISQEAEMLDGAPVLPDGTLLYAGHAERARVQDGWVLVPREPTKAMRQAGAAEAIKWPSTPDPACVWNAMLTAAPSAPEGDGGEG